MNQKFWSRWILHYSYGELIGIGSAATVGRLLIFVVATNPAYNISAVAYGVLLIAGLTEGLIIGYIQWKSLSSLIPGLQERSWVITTTLATVAGWVLIFPPAVMFISFLSAFDITNKYYSVLSTALAGIAFGGLIGIAQFFSIKTYYTNSIAWVLANAIGWGISFLLILGARSMFSTTTSFFINLMLIVASCILSGLIQGIVTGTSLHYGMSLRTDYI